MKRLLTFLFSIFFYQTIVAQGNAEMITSAKWERVKITKGLFWEHFHFKNNEIFDSNQNINIVRTKIANKRLEFGFLSADDSLTIIKNGSLPKNRLLTTSKLAELNSALVAINGTFFDTKKGGSVDLLKINDRILDTTRAEVGKRAEHQLAAIVIDQQNIQILKGIQTKAWDIALNYPNVMVTGPLLLEGRLVQDLKKTPLNDNRHPRSCVCLTTKKELLLITIDGRSAESNGLNLRELTMVCQQLKCKDAINLDGGGSSTLYVNGQPDHGVVNMPCDNKKFDHFGERPVSNAFGVWLKGKN
jgi:exopolysaccharide biosynthesis protein